MNQVVGSSRVMETEVVEKAKRRLFTAEYKQRILAEIDRASASGEIGAILRREGLYSSVISAWRRQREAGEFSALTPKKRGPKVKVPDARDRELVETRRKLAKAEARCFASAGIRLHSSGDPPAVTGLITGTALVTELVVDRGERVVTAPVVPHRIFIHRGRACGLLMEAPTGPTSMYLMSDQVDATTRPTPSVGHDNNREPIHVKQRERLQNRTP